MRTFIIASAVLLTILAVLIVISAIVVNERENDDEQFKSD